MRVNLRIKPSGWFLCLGVMRETLALYRLDAIYLSNMRFCIVCITIKGGRFILILNGISWGNKQSFNISLKEYPLHVITFVTLAYKIRIIGDMSFGLWIHKAAAG